MTELKTFNNAELGSIRTMLINNEPWFVGKDVADALGYADAFGALKKYVDNEDKQNCQNGSFETPRGME
jgi:prophage antirepressor-like protein